MNHLVYSPYLSDTDLWIKPMIRTNHRTLSYAYILCCVDYTLIINHCDEDVLKRLDNYFNMKPVSLGDPDIYLGAKLRKINMHNGVWAWDLSST